MLNDESKILAEIEIKALYQKFRATQKKLTAATLELKKRFEEFHEELDEYCMAQSDEWIYESQEGTDFSKLTDYYNVAGWAEIEDATYIILPQEPDYSKKVIVNPLITRREGLIDNIEEHRELDRIGDQLDDCHDSDEYHKLNQRYRALELICYPDER